MTAVMGTGPVGPAAPPRLVGREDDVAAVIGLLEAARLVTVVGPPGAGKTRLVAEVADAMAGTYPDAVWRVELSSVRRAEDLASAVAPLLGASAHDDATALVDALRHRRLLLVLDGCEHLVEACATLADRLLSACPDLSVLVTSRERLAVAGERVWRLRPLAVPDDGVAAPDELADGPAVRLFVHLARQRDPEFALTESTAPAVAEICRRVDGLPLAIEVAADRAALVGTDAVAQGVRDRVHLVATDGSPVPGPHEALGVALDRSHDLLDPARRVLLRRLSVFEGDWTLEAAEAVSAGGAVTADAVFDLLAGLVDCSLVEADTAADCRYRLLASTRAYARDRLLEAGEAADVQAAHATWCVALAERAAPELADGAQHTWLERLDAEHDDLVAALRYATRGEHASLALRLAGALTLYWSMRARLEDGRDWLERALEVAGGTPAQRAAGLWGAALLARALGDHAAAKARASECLDLARRLDDTRLTARALSVLGAVGVSACDGSTMTTEMLEESLALARRAGDAWCEIGSLTALGFGHLVRGDPAAGRGCFEQCLTIADRRANQASDGHRVHALVGLGRAALAAGDHRTAERLLADAASLSWTRGLLAPAANALRFLGEAASTRGDYDAARRAFEDSLDLARRMGARGPMALALSALGRLALTEGDAGAAESVLEEARSLGVSRDSGTGAACALTGLGAVERALGDAPEARTRLDEALATARRAGDREAAARALYELGRLAHREDDNRQAAAHLHEALARYRELSDTPALAGCLEVLASVEIEEGRLRTAARLLGAAEAVRTAGEYPRAPADQSDYEANLAVVRRALGREAFDEAFAEGAALSAEEASAYAARGRGRRPRARHGWASLSRREGEVARLVGQRLTNTEIGRRLLISPRTVQTHLAHAYRKLGVSSRSELADVAAGAPSSAL